MTLPEDNDFWVGDRLVRPALGEIRVGLDTVRVERRSMDVLRALCERATKVVLKEELIRLVWGEAFVSDEVLTHAIWDLRRALGDNASAPEFIQTVPKRGYRMIAPVKVEDEAEEEVSEEDRKPRSSRRWVWWAAGVVLALPLALALGLVVKWGGLEPSRERINAYFEVVHSEAYEDSDFEPWFSLWRDDVRAIRHFFDGVGVAYRNETGSADWYETARLLDPEFVAPWVYGVSHVRTYGTPEQKADYLAKLGVLKSRSSFEGYMIAWARAFLEDEPQVKHLELAHAEEPENQPVRFVLAERRFTDGDAEGAGDLLDPLVGQEWDFPGLYPLAAKVALLLSEIDEARRILEVAQHHPPLDLESLGLAILISVFDDDAEGEAKARTALARRIRETRDEQLDLDLSAYAEVLAERAVEEGRPKIAARLRESEL